LNPVPWVEGFYTPDAELNFANLPTVKGHEAIVKAMTGSMQSLESMKHTVGHIDVMPDRIYQEAKIQYVVKGDSSKELFEVMGFAVYHKTPKDNRMHR